MLENTRNTSRSNFLPKRFLNESYLSRWINTEELRDFMTQKENRANLSFDTYLENFQKQYNQDITQLLSDFKSAMHDQSWAVDNPKKVILPPLSNNTTTSDLKAFNPITNRSKISQGFNINTYNAAIKEYSSQQEDLDDALYGADDWESEGESNPYKKSSSVSNHGQYRYG